MSTYPEEPSIPEKLKWPLVALWVSLGLHGALIALVQIAPMPSVTRGGTLEARLVSVPRPLTVPELAPSAETDEAIALDVPEADEAVDPETEPSPPLETTRPDPPPPPESAIPQLEIPIAVDLHYYAARELDQTPGGRIPDPVFPDTLSGRIRFEVRIEESGRVSDVEVVESDPPEMFDPAAIEIAREALRATHFTPGIKNGRPVRALVIYELTINPAATRDVIELDSP